MQYALRPAFSALRGEMPRALLSRKKQNSDSNWERQHEMSLSASSSKINDQLKIHDKGLPFSAMIWHQFRWLLLPKSSTHYQPANADPWPDAYPLCVTAMSVAKEVGNKRDKCICCSQSPLQSIARRTANVRHAIATEGIERLHAHENYISKHLHKSRRDGN